MTHGTGKGTGVWRHGEAETEALASLLPTVPGRGTREAEAGGWQEDLRKRRGAGGGAEWTVREALPTLEVLSFAQYP